MLIDEERVKTTLVFFAFMERLGFLHGNAAKGVQDLQVVEVMGNRGCVVSVHSVGPG